MSIVLDEYAWVKDKMDAHDLGNKPSETLTRVAKVYRSEGYSRAETRDRLDNFLLQCDPNASLPNWSETLDRIAKNADRFPLIQIDSVDITERELASIGRVEGRQVQRLAFTLLCAAKYWDLVSEKNEHWVNTPDREIMQMANISTSILRQSQMFAKLRAAGLIGFSRRVDNTNVQVLFIEDGEEALRIRDFRNLGYQYLQHCGEAYITCARCGLTVRERQPSKGRKQKYCPACAVEAHLRQRMNSVMRQRQSARNTKNLDC